MKINPAKWSITHTGDDRFPWVVTPSDAAWAFGVRPCYHTAWEYARNCFANRDPGKPKAAR